MLVPGFKPATFRPIGSLLSPHYLYGLASFWHPWLGPFKLPVPWGDLVAVANRQLGWITLRYQGCLMFQYFAHAKTNNSPGNPSQVLEWRSGLRLWIRTLPLSSSCCRRHLGPEVRLAGVVTWTRPVPADQDGRTKGLSNLEQIKCKLSVPSSIESNRLLMSILAQPFDPCFGTLSGDTS